MFIPTWASPFISSCIRYRTVKTLANLANYNNLPSYFVNIQNFHSIAYGLTIAYYPSTIGRVLSLLLLTPTITQIWRHMASYFSMAIVSF